MNMAKKGGFRVSEAARKSKVNSSIIAERNQDSGKEYVGSGVCKLTEKEEVLCYWFLLEKEMGKAIQKGNSGLLYIARVRIEFFEKARG